MTDPVFVQVLGFIALLLAICVFQINSRKTMLILSIAAALVWAGHFILLGALTAAVMNLLSAVRFYAYYKIKPLQRYAPGEVPLACCRCLVRYLVLLGFGNRSRHISEGLP